MNRIITIIGLLASIVLFQGCMADIRTALIKEEGITQNIEQKGKALLQKAWKQQGLDQLKNHQTYSFSGLDTWKGLTGKIGKPWPYWKSAIDFQYAIGTFDGKVLFKNGKREGVIAGLQSWHYYEQEPNAALSFKKYNKRIGFGISAFQYFVEMLDRLQQAPIIAYAGEKAFNGQNYDLVFVTWETPGPHMEHDQYLLCINQESGILDYAVYTLRDNYLKPPGYKAFYGSIHFTDYRNIDGIMIPHKQTVFLNAPKANEQKYAHQLIVSNFEFDGFGLSELYPDPKIPSIGDAKVEVK